MGRRRRFEIIAVVAAVGFAAAAISCSRVANGDPPDAPPEGPGPRGSAAPASATTTPPPPFQPPTPPGTAERADERHRLVERIASDGGLMRLAVKSPAVLEAMRAVPRHLFVPETRRAQAYLDTPLPIGHGQTISQPYIVALMSDLLDVDPGDRVLEIGTGSGYQAAVLAHLTPNVYTVEIIDPLAERAKATLESQGYDNVRCRRGDGYFGWPEHAPYDAIIVTCAAGHLPPPLWDQLTPGGRIVIPIGGPYEVQRLVLAEKQVDGSRRTRTITSVRFVPLTRAGDP